MEIRRYSSDDLAGIIRLCAIEKWPSFGQDAARANRALTAPGVTTVVAVDDGEVVGFAQLQSAARFRRTCRSSRWISDTGAEAWVAISSKPR